MFNRVNHKAKWPILVYIGFLLFSLLSVACAEQETFISDEVKDSVRKLFLIRLILFGGQVNDLISMVLP